jgi:metallo-beta-lactamase family protein
MRISFYGAARQVTGSCHLIETKEAKILLDCGLFQCSKECEEENFQPFGFNPAEIDAILVAHSHLDHIGRVPKLVKDGFRGKIYSTAPARDLAFLALEDALNLAVREGEAIYGEEDLEKTKSLWESVSYYETISLKDAKFRLSNAGHILGSALIEIWAEEKHILYTGDLGNSPSVLLPPYDTFKDLDYLIIESTYGNKTHESFDERRVKLERAMEDIAAKGGTLMIPAFATERTQEIIFYLNDMLAHKRIPQIPVFVDSPLAIRATRVFEKYPDQYKEEIRELYREHPNLFKAKNLKFTETVEESKSINDVPPPKAVIAGSGMMAGGRILHHARRYLQDPKSMLLIVGYQAAGSLGRRLIDGASMVKLFGEEIPVRAEIRKINGFSAHADEPQLFSFVETAKDSLKKVFVVHGEEAQAMHLTQEIKDRLGVEAEAPMAGGKFEI